MGKFEVSKSTVVHAAPEKVFAAVKSFQQWQQWSPWLLAEHECKVEYLPDGQGFSWVGDIVGSGQVDLVDVVENHSIECDLVFFKPIKSRNRIRLVCEPTGDGSSTEVTWFFKGSLPFFLFWMRNKIGNYIRDDLERGLHLLTDFIETGKRSFRLDFPGIGEHESADWVGIRRKVLKAEMGFRLSQDFATLLSWLEEREVPVSGAPVAIYHKWDLSTQLFDYTALVPVSQIPLELPKGFQVGKIPSVKCYRVHLSGSFRFLPHAWACGVLHARSQVFKKDRRHAPFETFIHMPDRVDDENLEVMLYFPCR